MVRERFEVLHGGREVELVARAGEAAQTHALEAMVGLQVRKAHLDPLPLIAGLLELRRAHERARMVTGLFVHGARHFALGQFGQHFDFRRQGPQSSLLVNSRRTLTPVGRKNSIRELLFDRMGWNTPAAATISGRDW